MIPTITFKLQEKKWLAKETLWMSFKLSEGFDFKPGQGITFFFQKEDKKYPRSYSIFKYHDDDTLELIVRIREGGVASTAFVKLKEGESIPGKGPFGFFLYNPLDKNSKVVFIATGTGIAPIHPMITEHITKQSCKEYTLIFGSRTKKELYFDEEFRLLEQESKENPNTMAKFSYIPVLSREEWTNSDKNNKGQVGHVQDYLPIDYSNTTFYICGNKNMVQETTAHLQAKGVKDANIRTEKF